MAHGPAMWSGNGVRGLSTGNSTTVTTNRLGDSGGATFGLAGYRATLWRGGRTLDLGTDGTNSYVWSLNDRGLPDGREHAFRWEKVVMTDLTPGAVRSAAVAVNEVGDVTGTLVGADDVERPFLWHRGRLTTVSVTEPVSVTGLHPLPPMVIGSSSGKAFI
jgi:uncharacterized membrane protein